MMSKSNPLTHLTLLFRCPAQHVVTTVVPWSLHAVRYVRNVENSHRTGFGSHAYQFSAVSLIEGVLGSVGLGNGSIIRYLHPGEVVWLLHACVHVPAAISFATNHHRNRIVNHHCVQHDDRG